MSKQPKAGDLDAEASAPVPEIPPAAKPILKFVVLPGGAPQGTLLPSDAEWDGRLGQSVVRRLPVTYRAERLPNKRWLIDVMKQEAVRRNKDVVSPEEFSRLIQRTVSWKNGTIRDFALYEAAQAAIDEGRAQARLAAKKAARESVEKLGKLGDPAALVALPDDPDALFKHLLGSSI